MTINTMTLRYPFLWMWMKRLLSIGFCCLLGQGAFAQMEEYLVTFDTGKTAISLGQLDTIQALARQLSSDPAEKIVVYAYASDARNGDTNQRLAHRRSYLIQQCLERAGVPLSRLHMRHFTCGPDELGCPIGARLWTERNAALKATNAYQARNLAYVWKQLAPQYEQTYFIDPQQATTLTLRSGHRLWIPAGAFQTTSTDTIELQLREINEPTAGWQHGLLDRSPYGVPIAMQALQGGQWLPATLNYPMSLLTRQQPVFETIHQPYQAAKDGDITWVIAANAYQHWAKACREEAAALTLPEFQEPPAKPAYQHPDSASALQDEAIASLTERLQALEALRYNKSGKKEIWTDQQKERAYKLKNQRDRLLVQRATIRRKVLDANTLLEEAYYKAVAAYNQQRNGQQQGYLKSQQQQTDQGAVRANRCQELSELQGHLAKAHTPTQLAALQAQATQQGLWVVLPRLVQEYPEGAPYLPANTPSLFHIKTTISAYKITAYWQAEGGGIVVQGQAIDANTIEFQYYPQWRVSRAKIWAVAEGEEGFETGLLEWTPDSPALQLQLDATPFAEKVGQALPSIEHN